MGYLVGTDEAGYGPNLGPLVISVTVWETSEGVGVGDLFQRLESVIVPRLDRAVDNGEAPVAMADSKALYAPGKGLRHLERGLWAALGLLGRRPRTRGELWQALAPEARTAMASIPWYADHDGPAPSDRRAQPSESLIEALHHGFSAADVRLTAVRSRVIFEEEFNALVERHGSKGAALSHETLALAARMIAPLPSQKISVVCDKHGGRNRYGPLLAEHFPEWFVEIHGESRSQSLYRFGPPERRIEFCFRTKAESTLPAALASMASKYLRELAMQTLNHYWRNRMPNLRPTAGYPQDAKRFRVDIAEEVKRLGISERALWRIK